MYFNVDNSLSTRNFDAAISALRLAAGEKIHGITYARRGRCSFSVDNSEERAARLADELFFDSRLFKSELDAVYEKNEALSLLARGNDAPRGGKNGNFFTLTAAARKSALTKKAASRALRVLELICARALLRDQREKAEEILKRTPARFAKALEKQLCFS